MAAWFRTLLRTTLMVMHMAWRAISTVKLQGHTGWQKPSGVRLCKYCFSAG